MKGDLCRLAVCTVVVVVVVFFVVFVLGGLYCSASRFHFLSDLS